MVTAEIQKELESLADPGHAEILQRFFKTGPGEYGEGDRFRGIRAPVLRKTREKISRPPPNGGWTTAPIAFHEDRLLALLSNRALLSPRRHRQDGIHRFYLNHTGWVNNWDLVDVSAPHLVGHY